MLYTIEGEIQIGDTFRKPKFRQGNRLQTFDRVLANPMWNQTEFKEKDYDADEFDRFPKGAGKEYRPIVEIVEELNVLEEGGESN